MRRIAFDGEGDVHELTFSTHGRVRHFAEDENCMLFLDYVDAARRRQGFSLCAYVVMPEHVHLVVWPGPKAATVAEMLKSIKQPFARRMKALGKCGERFWLAGGGYDRNLRSPRAIEAAVDYIHRNPIRRGLSDDVVGYRWSSARDWYDAGEGYLRVDRVAFRGDP